MSTAKGLPMLPQQFIIIFLTHSSLFKGLGQDFQLNISYLLNKLINPSSEPLPGTLFPLSAPYLLHWINSYSPFKSQWRYHFFQAEKPILIPQDWDVSFTIRVAHRLQHERIVQGTTNTTIHGNPSHHAFPKQSLIVNSCHLSAWPSPWRLIFLKAMCNEHSPPIPAIWPLQSLNKWQYTMEMLVSSLVLTRKFEF